MARPARARACSRRRSPASCSAPGQPLDAAATTSSFPTPIGHGKSTKPSDGLRTKFPQYNYDDMVDAQYRLVTEHLGVQAPARGHRQLDGRHGDLDLAREVSRARWMSPCRWRALPTEMSSRNWMLRRLITDSIRNDPEWKNGNYTQQPQSAQFASVFFGIATSGGNQALYKAAPTREKADQLLDRAWPRRSPPMRTSALPVGLVARLQPVGRTREDQGRGARDQRRRRRAQSAGDSASSSAR